MIKIREFAGKDSLAELTALLHRAYAGLGEMGLNFTAVDQTVEVTANRIAQGTCYVAEYGGQPAGTITVYHPYGEIEPQEAKQTEWLHRPDTARFGQLGVEPRVHGKGIGSALILHCETWAKRDGYQYMALDTAMPAKHLRDYYERLGYVSKDEVQWVGKLYRTIIMVKAL